MGMRALIFREKTGKNGKLLTLLAHKQCSLARIDVFFFTKFGHDNEGIFHTKFEKIT